MRYVKPDNLSASDVGKWAHMDFGQRSFAIHIIGNRALDKVTIEIDGKGVVFVEHRVDDGLNNWFERQYLESEENFGGLKLRWTKNKLLSVTGSSITVEGHFDYVTPANIPFLGKSFSKTLTFPKSDIAEILIYASEFSKDPRDISTVPEPSSTTGSIKLQFLDELCKRGVDGVSVGGSGPQKLRKLKTDSAGELNIENLKPGTYTVTAEKYGFKKLIIPDLHVIAGMQYQDAFAMIRGFASDDKTPFLKNYDPCKFIDKPLSKFMHVGQL